MLVDEGKIDVDEPVAKYWCVGCEGAGGSEKNSALLS